ncbi:MAG: hypothetical protein VX916_03360 [Planctomycetota bacterium]|nr:hypothetical protein [Planctomycetota bacterium]
MKRMRSALPLLVALTLVAASCAAPPPPSHLTRLWISEQGGDPIRGLATEDGILVLADPSYEVGDLFDIQFPLANSVVRDWGELARINDNLGVIRPLSARLVEGRFSEAIPHPDDQIYLAIRDDNDEPVFEPVETWHGGEYGDFILPPSDDARTIASRWAGSGLYVQRQSRWRIVGMLSGLTATTQRGGAAEAVGYIGLREIARILPEQIGYFEHDVLPLRPDFEFGVPLQEGDVDIDALRQNP